MTATATQPIAPSATATQPIPPRVKWVKAGAPAQDPFLMVGLHDDFIPGGSELDATPGFPQHPHRGFETVTYVLKGIIDHADTLGASGRYSDGDVQWMTAGSGVCHSEISPMIELHKPNRMHVFQLWLNLPAKSKMCPPHTQMLWNEDIPITTATPGVTVKHIAGRGALSPNPDSWANNPLNAVQILHITIAAGSQFQLERASHESNIAVYVFGGEEGVGALTVPDGSGTVDVPVGTAVAFEVGSKAIELANSADGGRPIEVLVLEGMPIAEPVAAHGPFVMNTQQQIREAFESYRSDSWSVWPWDVDGPIHGDSCRFEDDGKGDKSTRGSSIHTIDTGAASYMPEMKRNGWKAGSK